MRSVLLTLMLVCAACGAAPPKAVRSVPLKVDGPTVLLVKAFPIQLTAPEGGYSYTWNTPSYWTDARTTKNRNILTINSAPKGVHTISVTWIIIDFDKKEVVESTGETTFAVGDVSPAPPDPGPGPKPPDPTPTPAGALRVLIVYETADLPKLETAQRDIIFSPKVKGVLKDRTDKSGPDDRGWNIWDKDIDASGAHKFWQDGLKRPRTTTPYIHMWKGETPVFEGPLPKSVEETINLITKHAG